LGRGYAAVLRTCQGATCQQEKRNFDVEHSIPPEGKGSSSKAKYKTGGRPAIKIAKNLNCPFLGPMQRILPQS
jgi:hypothetical protein